MKKLESQLKQTFIDMELMPENWRFKVTEIKTYENSDCADVTVSLTKYRCRKPCIIWYLNINMVHETVDFNKSQFVRL